MRLRLPFMSSAAGPRHDVSDSDAAFLSCRGVEVAYDKVQVLFGADIEVQPGEIVALLGTNGAGKSTLLRAISGITAPSNGAIFYDGEDISYLPPHEHVARGIVTVPGGKGVFPRDPSFQLVTPIPHPLPHGNVLLHV